MQIESFFSLQRFKISGFNRVRAIRPVNVLWGVCRENGCKTVRQFLAAYADLDVLLRQPGLGKKGLEAIRKVLADAGLIVV